MKMLEKILEIAKRRGLSQTELEHAAALAKGRISKWKSGQGIPGWDEVVRLARTTELPLDFLADDNAKEPPAPIDGDERLVMDLVHRLGTEEALNRLMDRRPPRRSTGETEFLEVDMRPQAIKKSS